MGSMPVDHGMVQLAFRSGCRTMSVVVWRSHWEWRPLVCSVAWIGIGFGRRKRGGMKEEMVRYDMSKFWWQICIRTHRQQNIIINQDSFRSAYNESSIILLSLARHLPQKPMNPSRAANPIDHGQKPALQHNNNNKYNNNNNKYNSREANDLYLQTSSRSFVKVTSHSMIPAPCNAAALYDS